MATILVVDDAAFVRLQYRKALTDLGFTIKEASNGQEAVDRYREYHPDGVLLDINMPERDGISALYEIIEIDPDARVAMISCISSQTMRDTVKQAGAREFIVKPAGKDVLSDSIRRLISVK